MNRYSTSVIILVSALSLLGCGGGGGGGTGGGSGGSGGGSAGGGTGGGMAASGTVTLSGQIIAPTTWSDIPSVDCDYLVKANTTVALRADVTVQPGVKICFEAKSGMEVDSNGSFNAAGTAEKSIILTGTSPTKGFWDGLLIESNNVKNVLTYVQVEYGGGEQLANRRANVVVGSETGGASISISNSTFSQSQGDGLGISADGRLETFAKNTFHSNTRGPMAITMSQLSALDVASVYSGAAMPNGLNKIRVKFGDKLSQPVTMRKLDAAYAMSADETAKVQDVGTTVTVEAGARLEFEANTGLKFETNGNLVVNGTDAAPVVFTGRSMTKGFWRGLAFLSTESVLNSTEVSYAGSDEAFCCGFFEPRSGGPSAKAALAIGDYQTVAKVTINNVKLVNSLHRGYTLMNGSSLVQMGTNDVSTGNVDQNCLATGNCP